MLSADERRLRRAQDDAAAFSAEVRQVIVAQRQQIAVLEKQAQQLANEAEAEQRYTAGLHANDKSTKLARLQAEHASLGASLDSEGRRALELASKVEMAEMGKHELHTAVSTLEEKRRADKKGKVGSNKLRIDRVSSLVDETLAHAARLREEVDHLRRERLVFLAKLRDIEHQLYESRDEHDQLQHEIRSTSESRESALSHARHLEDANEKRQHERALQRQQVDQQLATVEKQARLVRSKLRQKMMGNALAASQGGSALHKIRLAKSAWPPPQDTHGLLSGVQQPQSLQEHIAVLAYLIGGQCPEELESVCSLLAAEDREHANRARALEEKRQRLAAEEERNARARNEVSGVESTGGVDTAEHLSLREQLTEMQSQGGAIRMTEERHALVLDQCAAVAASLEEELRALDREEAAAQAGAPDAAAAAAAAAAAPPPPPPPDRAALGKTVDATIAAVKRGLLTMQQT